MLDAAIDARRLGMSRALPLAFLRYASRSTGALGADARGDLAWASVLPPGGWLFGAAGCGHVEQDHGVMVGGAGLGEVDAEALAGGAL